MALLESIVAFVVSLLVGALGIYLGALLIVDINDYSYAIVVAFVGAVVWALVSFFFGWFPLLGPVVTLLAWMGTIKSLYPGGWSEAALIGFIAWVSSMIILAVIAGLGFIGLDAFGVPGV